MTLVACLMWIMWCNVFIWAIDSFVEMSNGSHSLMPIYSFYYGADLYEVIHSATMPFGQLYRITSVFLFVKILLIEC